MRIQACRTCGAPIVWTKTTNGRPMPINAAPDPRGVFVLSGDDYEPLAVFTRAPAAGTKTYSSHFSTCAQAREWRRTPPSAAGKGN